MRKLLIALLAISASSSFASGEVGASNPNASTENLVVAIAETGVSQSWTSRAFEGKATAHEIADMNARLNIFHASITASLALKIDENVSTKIRAQLDQ